MEIGNLERSGEWDKMSEELAWSYSFHFVKFHFMFLALGLCTPSEFDWSASTQFLPNPLSSLTALQWFFKIYQRSAKPRKWCGSCVPLSVNILFLWSIWCVSIICRLSWVMFLFLCTESLNRNRKTALFHCTKKPTTSANANWRPVEDYLPTNQ